MLHFRLLSLIAIISLHLLLCPSGVLMAKQESQSLIHLLDCMFSKHISLLWRTSWLFPLSWCLVVKYISLFFVCKQADGFIKTGCFNTLCPGFVQVSTKIPLGYLFNQVSTYGGKQYEIKISIFQVASLY